MPVERGDAAKIAEFIRTEFGADVYMLVVIADKPNADGSDKDKCDLDCTFACSPADAFQFLRAAIFTASHSAARVATDTETADTLDLSAINLSDKSKIN